MNDKTTLKLTLTKQWFDLILEGEKIFEYREFKKHWIHRLLNKHPETGFYGGTRDYKTIEFTNGYGADKPWMRVEFSGIGVIKGKYIEPDNKEPIEDKKDYFVIGLGEVLETRNLTA